ncbi:MAG: carbohydrate-binding family V/XII, partial [Verrucomicrobiota bacterium]
ANLAVTSAESKSTVPVQNPVPAIFFSESSAVLVLVNGEPALRPVAGTQLLRAINTQALLVMDQSSGTYYLRINGGWSQAPALAGPWTAAQNPPASLATALQNAPSTTQLFDPPKGANPGPAPAIFVSTGPAELITTQGVPQFSPIAGTQLLRVSNSSSSVFVYVPSQAYYVVISGRWFSSVALTGPWQYVAAAQLPADFANIPESDPAGTVLASVAGTPQAGEAAISSTIPQTATIARTATTKVSYAGDPEFKPVEGTQLSYAVNTETPVVKVAEDSFYAVVNGVWFVARAALGPWTVADSVPPAIYTIPPSCPIYYATNVYVYGSTPDVVYAGYTPGYFGPCLSPEGVVVFGTGFWYPPYIGPDVWIGPPLTYGFGAGFACGLATGFAFGLAADHGWGCSPWWGPWHGGWGNVNNVNINRNWNNVNVNAHNAYNNWSNNVVKNTNINRANVDNAARNDANNIRTNPDYQNWKSNHPNAAAENRPNDLNNASRQALKTDATHLGDNNVFAGKDGNAYRSTDSGGWESHESGGWSNPDRSSFNDNTRSD